MAQGKRSTENHLHYHHYRPAIIFERIQTQYRVRPPVTISRVAESAGPTANTVREPGATCVFPASATRNVGSP